MSAAKTALCALLALAASSLGATPARAQGALFAPTTRIEQAAAAVMAKYSEKELRELQGFFAPVVKKWTPVAEKFAAEYAASSNKTAIISRYLPKVRQVLDDARRMRIPAKYEPERERYVATAEALYAAITLYVKLDQRAAR